MATQRMVPHRATAVAPRPNVAPPQRSTSVARPPRRGVWTFFCFSLFAAALIGGEVAARYQPELALSFRGFVVNLLGRLPESVTPGHLLQAAAGGAVVLVLLLIWQAGRSRRPLFVPLALFLCLASCAVGVYRGGRDLDLERNLARLGALEGELGALKKKLDTATGSLQKSTLAIQERDETIRKFRAEIESLQKDLAEKD